MPTSYLTDRAVILVNGEDAQSFLQGLVTVDVEKIKPGEGHLAALLSPQGKILFDFLVATAPAGPGAPVGGGEPSRSPRGYVLDAPVSTVAELVKRLNFYKLRAKVRIEPANESGEPLGILAIWGDEGFERADAIRFRDRRSDALGERMVLRQQDAVASSTADPAEYHAHRIGLGIPEGGKDFAFGDAYPHDADMDQLGGVDFDKGCYVGQEIVSRMEHRGTARRRIVLATGTALPPAGTAITAGARPVGTLGSVADGHALALVRLDRVKEAMDAGTPLVAGDVPIDVAIPPWAHVGWLENTD